MKKATYRYIVTFNVYSGCGSQDYTYAILSVHTTEKAAQKSAERFAKQIAKSPWRTAQSDRFYYTPPGETSLFVVSMPEVQTVVQGEINGVHNIYY